MFLNRAMAGEGRRAIAGAAGVLLVIAAGLVVAGEVGAGRLGAVGAGGAGGVFSGRTELLEKLRMTQLLGNATEVEVEFPADYPNSVRHFFLIGFLAQLLTSALFFFMSLRKGHESMPHALAWIAPAIGALAYLAMWAGVAVWYKTSDETPRVIFWARYINHILGTPVSSSAHPPFSPPLMSRSSHLTKCVSMTDHPGMHRYLHLSSSSQHHHPAGCRFLDDVLPVRRCCPCRRSQVHVVGCCRTSVHRDRFNFHLPHREGENLTF